jgi:hypothetical protein
MCRMPSPPPGPVCATRPTGFRGYAQRVRNVQDAFLRGLNTYAYNETVAKLGSDVKLIVDSLWPGFMQALKIYAWSIGSGAVLFGALGAILGEGAGAVPGAIIGAKIGAVIGTEILFYLGIAFLAEYVLAHLDEADGHFKAGFKEAWEACGDPPPIDHAAREFGRAIEELMSLVLEAAVAWVIKKGLKAGLEELNKSKAGQALAPYAKVQYWREKLGVTDAEVPRRGIARTIEFFEEQIRKGNLKPMEEKNLLSHWKGMDFSKEIKPETLRPGKELVAYRDPQSPFGYYYTEPGTYLDRVGVDYVTERGLPEGVQVPKERVSREFIRYRVRTAVETLKSTSSGVRAFDTKNPVPGGGTQYFIPRAWDVLERIPETTTPTRISSAHELVGGTHFDLGPNHQFPVQLEKWIYEGNKQAVNDGRIGLVQIRLFLGNKRTLSGPSREGG